MYTIVRANGRNGRLTYTEVKTFDTLRTAVLIGLILSRTAERQGLSSAYSVYATDGEYTHLHDINRHIAEYIAAEYNIGINTIREQVDKE